MNIKHSLMLFFSSVLIIGCGLKGDLYEPGSRQENGGVQVNPQESISNADSVEKDSVEKLVDDVMQEKKKLNKEKPLDTSSPE